MIHASTNLLIQNWDKKFVALRKDMNMDVVWKRLDSMIEAYKVEDQYVKTGKRLDQLDKHGVRVDQLLDSLKHVRTEFSDQLKIIYER